MVKRERVTGWQDVKSAKQWSDFLTQNPQLEANFTQSFNWGEFYRRLGNKVFHRAYYDSKNKIQAGYIAILEKAKFYNFLTISGGPLLDWFNQDLLKPTLEDLTAIGYANNCSFVRLRPSLKQTVSLQKQLRRNKLRPSPMPLSVEMAGLIDLNQSDEDILSNMSQSLRRKLRKADKDPQIKIKVSRRRQDAELFAQAHQEHAKTHNYIPFTSKRIVTQFETFVADKQALLYLAYRDDQLLAANMIFFYGQEASYHFGISTPSGQRYSSAPLLHLAAMEEAKRRGLKIYNFWGIVGVNQTKHRYYGLSQFKRSFGVIEHQYMPAHDLVLQPIQYRLIWLLETVRRQRRRL